LNDVAVNSRVRGAGVEIALDISGPADGAPVILLHGGGQTRASWGGAAAEGARRGFRMLNMDQRGHGETGWAPDGDYHMRAFADDIQAVADTLSQPPFLVGASMGGIAALEYIGRDRPVRGLVLVDIAPRIEQTGADRIRDFMTSAPDGFASLEEAAEAVASYLPHRPRPKNVSGLARNLRLRDGRYHWHWDPAFLLPRDVSPTSTGYDPERLEANAMALNAPILLVRGRMSDVVSPEGAQAFVDLIPTAEFADIAGADHMVAGDANDAFNAAVFSFLERHR